MHAYMRVWEHYLPGALYLGMRKALGLACFALPVLPHLTPVSGPFHSLDRSLLIANDLSGRSDQIPTNY